MQSNYNNVELLPDPAILPCGRPSWKKVGKAQSKLLAVGGSAQFPARNVRAKMPDTVGLGFSTASTSQPHQPLPGDWLETWRLGDPYQLEQLSHISSCFYQGKQMNCAMQEEESISYIFHMCSAACYFCLFSCLIRRAILWNPRNSPAVTVINRDGDGAGKRIIEAQIQCVSFLRVESLRSLHESQLQCGGNTVSLFGPIWVQSGPFAIGAWHCPEGPDAVPRCWAGSGGWEQKLGCPAGHKNGSSGLAFLMHLILWCQGTFWIKFL